MGLAKRIIPCLDIARGRVVKGVRFLGLRDACDPLEIARRYDDQGADELMLLDINARPEQREATAEVVRALASEIFLPLTVGGGIRDLADIGRLLRAGADRVAINTAAVLQPELLAEATERYGTQCIVLALDAKRCGKAGAAPAWKVHTHGGRKATELDALEWARRAADNGVGEILLASVDHDGKRQGYDLELVRAVSETVPVPVIACGGVGSLEHLYEGLQTGQADAVQAATLFHYGQHTIGEVKQYLFSRGVNVRL